MAIENELPHFTADAAHALEAARLTIAAQQRHIEGCERNVTELQAEVRRLQEQWDQAEAHNNDLREQLAAICAWCQANARAARNRAAQTGDSDWLIRQRVVSEVWNLVKPVV